MKKFVEQQQFEISTKIMLKMLNKFLASKVVTCKIHTRDEIRRTNRHINEHIFISFLFSSIRAQK